MKSWHGSMLVCDDVLFSLNGKVNLLGTYTGDIGVPNDSVVAPQLVFYFIVEGDLAELPKTPITIEIAFPSGDTRQMMVAVAISTTSPGRTKWFVRAPFLVQQVALKEGRIEGKIKYDGGELPISGPWIVYTSPAASPAPSAS